MFILLYLSLLHLFRDNLIGLLTLSDQAQLVAAQWKQHFIGGELVYDSFGTHALTLF